MHIEQNLIDQCIAKNQRAQQALFEACFPFLIKICRSYSRDDQEAMSYLNGGFYKILKGLKNKPDEIPFNSWAKRIVINSIIDHYRKYKKHRDSHRAVENLSIISNNNIKFDPYHVDQIFEAEDIIAMIRSLPKMTSLVFTLYAVDDFEYTEIAKKLDITESTVRWHVSKARRELIKRIEKISDKKKLIHEQAG